MMMMMKKKKRKKLICTTVPNGEEEEEELLPLLPKDMIMEIFSYLPPISLLRFKSLSKTIHSLISNHHFLRCNTVHQFRRLLDHKSPTPHPGILLKLGRACNKIDVISSPYPLHGDDGYDYYYSQFLQILIDNYGPPELDQPAEGEEEKVKFIVTDSCNGLVLVFHSGRKCSCGWYVCNPITKDYIQLPTFEQEEEQVPIYWWTKLVFDPSLSLTYKVVIWLLQLGIGWRIYVYSSDTRSWRLSVSINNNDFAFHVVKNYSYFRAVLLNGVLYYWGDNEVSLCYDVEKDSVWTLKFPKMPVKYVGRKLFYFGVCGGGLRLIQKYYEYGPGLGKERPFPTSFDVMEMNQLQLQQQYQDHQDGNMDSDRDLWTVKYRVNIGDQEGYYAYLIREKSRFDVCILDLYKTTTTKAGRGEVEEEVLLCIDDQRCLFIPFNLSNNTFGKELRNNELGLNHSFFSYKYFSRFAVLRYAFTLFPLIH